MFLQNFLLWNDGNEIPEDYLLWSAYGALASTIGPRVWWDYCGQFFVYANPYILLVGPTGDRKTSAMDKAVDIMKEANPDTVLSAECESHQGIIRYMDSPAQERVFTRPDGQQESFHPYGLFASELMDYLAINPIGMVNFLTNIYDRYKAGYTYRLKGNDQFLARPYFVMCSCTTGDWLTKQMNANTFSQGYGRRSIIATSEGYVRMKAFYLPEHETAKQACVKWLKDLPNVVGPMITGPGAEEFFWDWYLKQEKSDDQFIEAWRTSKNINLLKLAMLTSLSERKDRIVTINHMQMALGLLNDVEGRLHRVTDKIGRSELTEPVLLILDFIKTKKGIVLEKELQARMLKHFRSTVELYQAVMHLRQTEQVVQIKQKNDAGVECTYLVLPERLK